LEELPCLVGVGEAWVEPVIDALGREDERGAVVDLASGAGGVGGDDDRGPQPPVRIFFVLVGVGPQLVQAGEGQGAAVGGVHVVALLARLAVDLFGLLFVVADGGDHGAALGERPPERRLLS
jgi:hypothetical protein